MLLGLVIIILSTSLIGNFKTVDYSDPLFAKYQTGYREVTVASIIANNAGTGYRAENDILYDYGNKEKESSKEWNVGNTEEVMEIVYSSDLSTTFDVRTPSGLSGEDLEHVLYGTGLAGLGTAFADMEEKYGVNALWAISVAALESSWGTSTIAVKKGNIFGIKAYDSSPMDSAQSYSTYYDSVQGFGKLISTDYYNKHKAYTPYAINKVPYATDTKWAEKNTKIMVALANEIGLLK